MSKIEIEVLCDDTNGSVVRMPDRAYPGLVVQGDNLINLLYLANEARTYSEGLGDEELIRLTGNVACKVQEMMDRYADGCKRE